jgi:collagen type III alpha
MKAAPISGWSRTICLVATAGCMVGLPACSFGSLDYLKNGQRRDGATQDVPAGPSGDAPTYADDSAGDDGGAPDTEGDAGDDGPTADPDIGGDAGDDGSTADPDIGGDAGDRGSGAEAGTGGATGHGGFGGEPGTGGVSGYGGTGGTADVSDGAAGGAGMGGQPGAGGTGGASGLGGSQAGTGGTTGSGGTGAAPADASPDSVTPGADTASFRCDGAERSGICWYLGNPGDSCATTCAFHGGNSPEAASHVGVTSQGGSASECGRLLGLLGLPGTVQTGTRSDGIGLGCVVALGLHIWLSSPPYSDSARFANIQLVCGCLE